MLLTIESGQIVASHLEEANALHVRLAQAVAEALDLALDEVLKRHS